ncbi:hypothetical protein QTP88_007561 [Uroleucon formosanum]
MCLLTYEYDFLYKIKRGSGWMPVSTRLLQAAVTKGPSVQRAGWELLDQQIPSRASGSVVTYATKFTKVLNNNIGSTVLILMNYFDTAVPFLSSIIDSAVHHNYVKKKSFNWIYFSHFNIINNEWNNIYTLNKTVLKRTMPPYLWQSVLSLSYMNIVHSNSLALSLHSISLERGVLDRKDSVYFEIITKVATQWEYCVYLVQLRCVGMDTVLTSKNVGLHTL